MVCYLLLCPLNCKRQRIAKNFARKIFHEKCQNLQNLRRFFVDISLLQVHVFIININTKICFIVFSTCNKNHKASIIWGKELEVSLFMLKWSFIVNSLFAYVHLKIINLVFRTRFCISFLRKTQHDRSTN